MSETRAPEKHGFQTEVSKLLHLMIHSLYSNKEIFLRELISNASDACDKLRFEALATPALLADQPDLEIQILTDADAGTLTIIDNGIGMNRDEVIENLGTIARSGTSEFMSTLTGDEQKDAALIGQFGVGFYSAFIVAKEVEVVTRRAGDDDQSATRWVSTGEGEFSVSDAEYGRGTRITLHLKSDDTEFAEDFRIRSLIRRYSDHIAFPVKMLPAAPPAAEGDDAEKEDAEPPALEAVNDATALWTRSRSDIGDEEYTEFYKHLSHDFEAPLTHSHNQVEGKREYTSLLYIPARAPFDMWNREAPRGLKLYVKRVFIMDDAEHFLPMYLRFVRGVVDASDLPLNVSRELLQSNKDVEAIKSALTRRVLDMLKKLAGRDAQAYQKFTETFGEVLKEGLAEDPSNRERIAELLRFSTSASSGDDAKTSLDEVIERLSDGQEAIYYLTGDSLRAARRSPHLEQFKARDIEVLLLTDRLDDWMIGHLPEYKGKPLQDISRGSVTLPGDKKDESDKKEGEDAGELQGLIERLTKLLEDEVAAVRVSSRLVESPACLVIGDDDMGPQMRRLLEASGQNVGDIKPEFELNPEHALVKRLDGSSDDEFEGLARVLLDQARIAAGETLPDPGAYVERINALLLAS